MRRLLLALMTLFLAAPAMAAPSFSIENALGDEADGQIEFIIRKHGKLNNAESTVRFSTPGPGTALPVLDYVSKTIDVTFAPNETLKSVVVEVIPSDAVEDAETMTAKLRPVSNARCYDCTAQGIITDFPVSSPPSIPAPGDPVPPAPASFSINDVSINEGGGAAVFTITKTGANGSASSLSYATADVGASKIGDYTQATGTLTFADADTSKTVNVPIIDDALDEPDEAFNLKITPVTNAVTSKDTGSATIVDNDATPAPDPTPDPQAPPPDIFTSTLGGMDSIPSNFDVNANLINVALAKTAAPDVVGAFRFVCQPGQLSRNDPIVYPNQAGKAHGHQFFGNTGANHASTYETLRTSGDSTCVNPLNRSAYWMPWLQDLDGVYTPNHVQIYYKRRPASDPKCSLSSGDPQAEGNCVPLPRGLRFIFGYDMVTGKAPSGSFYFMCSGGTVLGYNVSPTDYTHKTNLVDAMAVCPLGARFSVSGKAPDCWDGKRLDSANHRDHVAHSSFATGFRKCPSTHPYVIPGFTITAIWDVIPELKAAADAGTLKFSSDLMVPDAIAGTTFHSDWFGAWDDIVKQIWEEAVPGCINGMLSCADGDLGNGKFLKKTALTKTSPFTKKVPIPSQ